MNENHRLWCPYCAFRPELEADKGNLFGNETAETGPNLR